MRDIPQAWKDRIAADPDSEWSQKALALQAERQGQSPMAPVKRSNVGSLLLAIFKDRVGAVPCSACKQTMQSLNSMVVSDVRRHRDKIVERIFKNAKTAGKTWWATLLEKADSLVTGGAVTKTVIGMWLDEACDVAQDIKPEEPFVAPPSPETDSDWAVVVTSAPRKGSNPLPACLKSLVEAGWESPVVFAEPGTVVPEGVHTIRNEVRRGCYRNWIYSAKWAIENTQAKYILCVQDDALFHPDSKDFVEEHCLWPSERTAFVNLYTPKHYSYSNGVLRNVGVNQVTTGALWGTLAVVWRREVLEKIVYSKAADEWLGVSVGRQEKETKEARAARVKASFDHRRANPHLINNSDYFAGVEVNKLKMEMFFVDPSPVHHNAKVSAIGHGGNSGNRNCGRCSDHNLPLEKQVFPGTGKTEIGVATFPHIIVPTGTGGSPPPTTFQIRTSYLDRASSEYRWNISKGTIIKSLQSQTDKNFRIQLICNPADPLRDDKLAEFSKIAPTTVADEDWYNKPHDGVWKRVTRMDDDDIISIRFVELLNATPFDETECILTFPTGSFYDGDKTYQWEYPENQFLTLQTNTSLTPYHFHHVDYRLRMPTVIISPDIHWLWIRHSGVMSGAKPGRIHRRYKTKPVGIDSSVFPHFSIPEMKASRLLDTKTRFTETLRSKFGPFDVTVKNIGSSTHHDELTDIAARHGADKGFHSKGVNHQYTCVYHRVFSPIRNDVKKVLEFGVGEGAGLRTWSDYFPNAKIDGLDRAKKSIKYPRVATHQFNYHMKELDPTLRYDIIFDDADHVSSHQRKAFGMHSSLVKPGGFYVIEDLVVCRIDSRYADESPNMLETARGWVTNPPAGWTCMLYGDQLCILQRDKE